MKKYYFLCMFIVVSLLLSGCNEDKSAEAEIDAVIRTIDASALSEENKERGLKSAFNEAGFFERLSASMKSLKSKDGKTKYDFFAEAHPSEVLEAQYSDYYEYNADEDTIAEVNGKSTAIYWRAWLRHNIFIVLLVLVGVYLLIFSLFFVWNKPRKVKSETHRQVISVPEPVVDVPVAPSKKTEKLSINYERGLRIYCKNNGKDYGDVLRMYGGDVQRAFEAIYDFGSQG